MRRSAAAARRVVERHERILEGGVRPPQPAIEPPDLHEAMDDDERLARKFLLTLPELQRFLGFRTYHATYMFQQRHLTAARRRCGRSLRFERREVERLIGCLRPRKGRLTDSCQPLAE